MRCTEVPETGNCRDSITKWYYNPVKEACFRFNYGGCQGNENKFDSNDACMKFCRGVTGGFSRYFADMFTLGLITVISIHKDSHAVSLFSSTVMFCIIFLMKGFYFGLGPCLLLFTTTTCLFFLMLLHLTVF